MEKTMRKSFCRVALRALPLLVLAVFMAVQAQAVPLTTKYYSLDLPADWVVVSGPVKVQEAIQVVMGQKDHKSSALIIVGPANAGEAEQAAKGNADLGLHAVGILLQNPAVVAPGQELRVLGHVRHQGEHFFGAVPDEDGFVDCFHGDGRLEWGARDDNDCREALELPVCAAPE